MRDWKGYRKGVDVGGWLSQCPHTIERYETFVNKSDFEVMKSWGIDHVRIPVDYDLFEEKDGTVKESGYAYIDRAINWCEETGLNMILDLHKTYGFSFDDGEEEAGFFDNEAYQERFYLLWERFAEKYGNIGDRVAFELLNEVTDPAYCEKWNEIASKCIARIRVIAPTVKILVGGYWNNSAEAVKDIKVPIDDNIVINFHCYEPIVFTHQGAYWVAGMPTDFRYAYDHTFGEIATLSDEMFVNYGPKFVAAAKGELNKKFDSSFFVEFFAQAVKRAEELHTPLYCGEYGVIELANNADVLEWYKAINVAFEHYGIGRAAWSYKEMNFGLSDSRMDDVREELIKYL